ncbi:MAG: hypothetical protein NUV69_04525 [Candidatus Curtissbacteria bacterium]|nr:hypothetical protein [Candidatus Curtissbacteria bacterium]
MSSQTNFEQFVKELSDFRQISETKILHMVVQVVVKMYRFLTKDLDAVDVVILNRGKTQIYKGNNEVSVSNKHKNLIVWATFRFLESKVLANLKIN